VRDGDRHGRWDPCGGPITYQIDLSLGTPDELAAIHGALAAAADATGFEFKFMGESTDDVADPGVDAIIGYRDFPGDSTLGEGGAYVTPDLELYDGFAFIEAGLPTTENRHVLLHEIAHLLGLDHVEDEAQVMFSFVGDTLFPDYQDGDREGLRLVGATMECFPASAAIERAPQLVTWSD
ncbi:MAG: matrixin family metalloprotease, partial [Ilumatobacteraceae bacterium]